METKLTTLEIKETLFKSFLIIDDYFEKTIYDKNIYFIYKITNLKTNEVYIGKAKNIIQRAKNYINYFLKGDNVESLLIKDMVKIGIENFLMEIIETADNSKSARIKEIYYIDKYNSIKTGYNKILGSADYENRNYSRNIINMHTVYSKVIKSKNMCAINPETNEIIFSTGLKLFGDLIGRHKDEIKSFAKRQTKVNGFFIYYLNREDFVNQLYSANLKIEKNSIYSDTNLQYPEFIKCSEILIDILKGKFQNNHGFNIKFITQSSDGYKYDDVEKFLKLYDTLENKIYD